MIKRLGLLCGLAALVGGCATTRPVGGIQLGYSPDQVRGILGKPDRVYTRQVKEGQLEAWGYMPLWPGFGMPTEPIGSRGALSPEIPLETIRDDEYARIFFRDGKVVAVESRQNP